MRRVLILSLLLAGATLWLYWPVGGFDLVYYDDPYYMDSSAVREGVTRHSLWWAVSNADMANWHPVTSLSFLLTHQFFGKNAGAEHLVNAIIHAVNAGLLLLVLWGLTSVTLDPTGQTPANRVTPLTPPLSPHSGTREKIHCGCARWWRDCLRGIRSGWSRWRGFRSERTCYAAFSCC